jgi:hypothetical protein
MGTLIHSWLPAGRITGVERDLGHLTRLRAHPWSCQIKPDPAASANWKWSTFVDLL